VNRQISSGRDKTANRQMSDALNELAYWTEETKKDGTGKPEENPGGPKFYRDPQFEINCAENLCFFPVRLLRKGSRIHGFK
jgi:hypothetical protein